MQLSSSIQDVVLQSNIVSSPSFGHVVADPGGLSSRSSSFTGQLTSRSSISSFTGAAAVVQSVAEPALSARSHSFQTSSMPVSSRAPLSHPSFGGSYPTVAGGGRNPPSGYASCGGISYPIAGTGGQASVSYGGQSYPIAGGGAAPAHASSHVSCGGMSYPMVGGGGGGGAPPGHVSYGGMSYPIAGGGGGGGAPPGHASYGGMNYPMAGAGGGGGILGRLKGLFGGSSGTVSYGGQDYPVV